MREGAFGGIAGGGEEGAGDLVEYRWGPLAHAEIGEEAVAKWIAEFMVKVGPDDEEDAPEGDRKEKQRVHDRNVEAVKKTVEKAAGGAGTEWQ